MSLLDKITGRAK